MSSPPYFFDDDFIERRMQPSSLTPQMSNVAWRVEPAELEPANPLISPAHPWDSAATFNSGTVLKDPIDGLWKCWGLVWPHLADFKTGDFDHRLAYAVSEDGVTWNRPMLDGFPCLGQPRSNVLLDISDIGKIGNTSVLVHPDAEPARRYEMLAHAHPGYYKNPSKHVRGLPVRPEHAEEHPSGIYRFFSGDGIHWKVCGDGPLPLSTADSIFIHHDGDRGYVALHKIGRQGHPGTFVPYDIGAGSQRVLVRRESVDGENWSPYQVIVEPDMRDAHDTQFMDLTPVRQGNGYVGILTVYHTLNQTMDCQFAGSADGRNWFRPAPRVPCLHHGPVGSDAGALIYGSHRLVEDGDHLYFYYAAMEGLHGNIYGKVSGEYLQYGSLCRARWRKGRLWCVTPAAGGPTQAVVTTMPLRDIAGKRLFINASTHGDGEITVELLLPNWEGEPRVEVPGFTRKDSCIWKGDSLEQAVAWKNAKTAPRDGVMLRFYLRRARLYGYEWR